MSRVHKPVQKFVNSPIYPESVTKPGKVKIIQPRKEITDYKEATSLTKWLLLKYNMSYKTYRGKSKTRRMALREEYEEDTYENEAHIRELAYSTLYEAGVPFDSNGDPLGIGEGY